MLRLVVAIGICATLSGCVVQPQPRYWGRPTTPYAPGYYPRPYAPVGYVPPTQASYTRPSYPQFAYPQPPSGGVPVEAISPRASFADENVDYGVAPTTALRVSDFDAPTPTRIEGARTITTAGLHQLLASGRAPLLVDVIGGEQAFSLPNAVWLRDAGVGRHIDDDVQAWFDYHLARLTAGDKSRPLVIFCASRMCWLAHNATLRAVDLGFTEVYWYRGGRDSWQAAGLPMEPVAPPPS
ncbi:MAG: hypothetical protein EXR07_06765 [Acetobacteraceae bacterium]|nr:hypothetical protein [Acetobacteraceae bacterium]